MNIPNDIYTNYLYKNKDYVLIKDPKHTNESYHYTIWNLKEIKDITYLNNEIIKEINNFIIEIKILDLFENEKIYICYPPTKNRLHLHIVPKTYISYRPLEELYNWNNIDNIMENITKINYINKQTQNSNHLDLKFNICIVTIKNIENIYKLEDIILKQKIDYIVAIRIKHNNNLIEYLLNNFKCINQHLICNEINNYEKLINNHLNIVI